MTSKKHPSWPATDPCRVAGHRQCHKCDGCRNCGECQCDEPEGLLSAHASREEIIVESHHRWR